MFAKSGLFAVGLVAIAEQVMWSGRPQGDAGAAEIAGYYSAHAATVAAGDLVWVVAMGCLATAIARAATTLPRLSTVFPISSIPAIAALTLSAFVAASLALSAEGRSTHEALSLWQLEGLLYRVGVIALYIPIAVGLLAVRGSRLVVLGAAAVVALALGVLGLDFWSFTVQLLWFVIAFSSAALDEQASRISFGRRVLG